MTDPRPHQETSRMNLDQYRQAEAAHMRENTLQDRVRQLAKVYGWLCYHTYDSRRSTPGWPDIALVHPAVGTFLIRELKTMRGRISKDQRTWLDALTNAGIDVGIWRPIDLLNGDIENTLAASRSPRSEP